ncbi:uncharacterized protein F5147DRAFT_654515 [Suillus discolor]|uniref:Uncharacterized protein n=1 Tax=Suillus discolor TaxID=1912936 RepID=A0A9P7F3D8_9AGAM|nr:uncharacterized protein F5147DRAFT_654515 [Suillus discolor]KAG2103996.1 hypothetical protein F5147DRAFT_654515 [Suillus discolor]
MSTISDTAATANAAFMHVAAQIEHLLGQAIQLDRADPANVNLSLEMASILVQTLSPIVLLAAAELSEHINANSCTVVSTPVWTNIHTGDPRCKRSPLYPRTVGYQEQPRQPSPPVAGLSQPSKGKGKEKAISEDGEDTSHGPPSKRQRASKAIITSEDDRELDAAPDSPQPSVDMAPMPPQVSEVVVPLRPKPSIRFKMVIKAGTLTKLPPALKTPQRHSRSAAWLLISSEDERDETPKVGPATKGGTPYVLVPAATTITTAAPQAAVAAAFPHITQLARVPFPRFTMYMRAHFPALERPIAPAIRKHPSTVHQVPYVLSSLKQTHSYPLLFPHTRARIPALRAFLRLNPGCGNCVQRGVICQQGYNGSGGELTVCAHCHRSKQKCGSNGSAAGKPKKSTATPARRNKSKSHHPSPSLAPTDTDTEIPPVASTAAPEAPVVAATGNSILAMESSETGVIDTLRQEILGLRMIVTGLEDWVAAGEQEALSACLAEELAELCRHLVPLIMHPGPEVCLPIRMRDQQFVLEQPTHIENDTSAEESRLTEENHPNTEGEGNTLVI